MIFLDLLAIIFFIYIVPVPVLWSIFQCDPKWFKRFGNWNYVVVFCVYALVTILTFTELEVLITERIGPLPLTFGIGLALVIMGFILGVAAVKKLSLTVLISLPQIHPERYSSTLITDGVYEKVRHPRYTSFWMMALGFALATGMVSMWLLFLWSVIGLATLAFVEEHEMRQRFGRAYADYARRVPRFFPKFS